VTTHLDAPHLSICIPTYNFGPYIGETLQSVLRQMRPSVEIVVLDSGSNDETTNVVTKLQEEYSCLRYERAEERKGIDRDMARVVELARGQYCWLFSADDVMQDGALARILSEIEQMHDVYLCMHSNETLTMQPIEPSHPVLDLSEDASFQLADPKQQLRYFRLSQTTEAFFSYMSGLVIRKALWDTLQLNEKFVGTCWAHVARLFALIPTGMTVKFLAAVLVRRRGGNDSFATRGVVRRYAIAIQGYQNLAVQFWGNDSPQAFHIRRVLRKEFPLRMFLAAKLLCMANPGIEDKRLLDQLVARTYSDWSLMCLLNRVAYHLFPSALYRPARDVYRRLRGEIDGGRS
jgi:O-antigen biosynthesis alpha-1,3-abequosyltransferase